MNESAMGGSGISCGVGFLSAAATCRFGGWFDPPAIREQFAAVSGGLNERGRRLLAAVEACTAGYGGIAGWRRFQRFARAAVQSRTAEAGRRNRPDAAGLPLPAGNLEVEQDRASVVLPHHRNWRGTPLTSRLAVVELIAATTTKTGLKVRCELDTRPYPKGIKVSDEEMACLNIGPLRDDLGAC
jgi:Rhodopirellula transposase DDE domain